jgi:chromosome transmission fidelity protein 8
MLISMQVHPSSDPKKWVLIEMQVCPECRHVNYVCMRTWMQGDLESRVGDTQMAGKFIGDLHYTKSGTPVLIIGHHILYGKVVDLERPFVAVEKLESAMGAHGPKSDVSYKVEAIVRKKIIFKTRPKPIISNVPKKI